MLQPRILSREASLSSLATALNHLGLCSRHAPKSRPAPQLVLVRHASHAAQGRANGPKDSAGRRLGAKKTASQWVIPGNIIFKQRGTKWFPGENVDIGKDHTIYSLVHGYVRYYRNPALHPKRRYIGVALEKEGKGSQLPTPPNAPTRRRLGMYAAPIKPVEGSPAADATAESAFLQAHMADDSRGRATAVPTPHPPPPAAVQTARGTVNAFDPKYRPRHGGYGMANHEIGRAAERQGIEVEEFDRKNRWKAWRVRAKRIKEKTALKAARKRKTKGRKSAKKA